MKDNKKKVFLILLGILLVIIIGIGIALFVKGAVDKKLNSDDEVVEKKDEERESPPEKISEGKQLLYKVTKDGSDNALYLFGSIHVADERAYPLPDKVMKAFNDSEAIMVEFDLVSYGKNFEKQVNDMRLMLCEPGKTLKDYLSPEVYDKTIKYLKDNKMYNKAYESYKPAFIYTLMSEIIVDKSGLDSNKGIDVYFIKQAGKKKKEIIELESSEFQINILVNVSNALYNLMIDETISKEEEDVEGLKELYEAWLKGDIETILEEDEEIDEVPEELEADYEKYNLDMLTNRNKEMAIKAKQGLEEGKNIFLVVGTAHIIGDDGLVALLSNEGYKVEKIEY